MDFPRQLRDGRTRRRISQLELAVRAGTTQRHVSFLESGRSTPGRTMVIRLAESLGLPLRERNRLLLAAGYAPVYPQTSLADPALAHVRAALDGVLAGHLPYPAIVVDRYGELVAANAAFGVLTEGVAAELLVPPINVMRIALHPKGLAQRIANFPEWARHVRDRVHDEVVRNPDDRLSMVDEELAGYLPDEVTPPANHLGFAVPMRLKSERGELRLMTTITTFATAVDVTVAELKLEAFLPADQETADLLKAW